MCQNTRITGVCDVVLDSTRNQALIKSAKKQAEKRRRA